MPDALVQLISIASEELARTPPRWDMSCPGLNEETVRELTPLLSRKNGFYAFESALHVFPAAPGVEWMEVNRWNSDTVWKGAYDDLVTDCFFFAEDIFGAQFCMFSGNVWTFDPETGQKDFVADNLHEWVNSILGEYDLLTGYPLAHQWQTLYGPIDRGKRLIPKVPFVLGGDYVVQNLFAMEAARGMQLRGELAKKIRDYPDGSRVSYEVIE